jgi:hypothetical protein
MKWRLLLPIDLEEQCTDEMEVLLRRSLMMFAFAESKKSFLINLSLTVYRGRSVRRMDRN